MANLRFLGISGSTRRASYNSGLIRAAGGVLPDGVKLEVFDIGSLPLYNDDLYTGGVPESVLRFKERVSAADAILIATPEYNYSIPGVLKNALDWASRPPNTQPFDGKPAAIMGASGGPFGTVRAQLHLRQILSYLNTFTLNRPEVRVSSAKDKFDEHGNLTDEHTRERVRELVKALAEWTWRLKVDR